MATEPFTSAGSSVTINLIADNTVSVPVAQPAAQVTPVTTATPATKTVATAQPAATIVVPHSVTVTGVPGLPAVPGVARPGQFTPGDPRRGSVIGAAVTVTVGIPAVVITGASTSGPNYATVAVALAGGNGSWTAPGQADGAPDATYATWAVV